MVDLTGDVYPEDYQVIIKCEPIWSTVNSAGDSLVIVGSWGYSTDQIIIDHPTVSFSQDKCDLDPTEPYLINNLASIDSGITFTFAAG